jgi:DNA-methyltransferase
MCSSTFSPLRYPGGKFSMLKFAQKLIYDNGLQRCHYIEPYAGGAGLALALMYNGVVSEIYINDIDPAIWSFWYSILNYTEEFSAMVKAIPITVDEWNKQKEINLKGDATNPFTLGFSTFFLNRTNRSGIIKGAGVIGGKKQLGTYKMDCRFNKEELIERILRIKKYSSRINLSNLDTIEFIYKIEKQTPIGSLFFIDPPYYNKGSSLYTSFYNSEDHLQVAKAVKKVKKPWVVTYDNDPFIENLYNDCKTTPFNINYSLQTKKKGKELLISSKNLKIPDFEKVK